MSNNNITENKNILFQTCSILLTVIFFILSFLTGLSNIATFVLGFLVIGLVIVLGYKSFRGISFYSLGIILIPVVAYGVIVSLSYFSASIYSISTRIFLTFNMLLFVVAGYLSKRIEGFDFKWILKGIYIALAIICLINVISTCVQFGPFYGYRIGNYYAYYNGSSSRETIATSAYALCGFSIKFVPIEYYLFFPFLLATSIFYYLFINKKNKFDLISTICFNLVAFISLLFVISRIPLFFIIIYLAYLLVIFLYYIFKDKCYKLFKWTFYIGLILLGILAFLYLLNAQYSLTGFRSFIEHTVILDYFFNTNRLSSSANVILNGFFSLDKIIGFPIYFDFDYLSYCLPSSNVIANQFMYGGLFGLIFFGLIITLAVYTFINLRKRNILDKEYKYLPFLFVISYFVITMFLDKSSYFDMYDVSLILANYLSPFFYISLFILGHYYSLVGEEEVINEK